MLSRSIISLVKKGQSRSVAVVQFSQISRDREQRDRIKRRKEKLSFYDFKDEISAEEAVSNILYNTPSTASTPTTRHVFNCLVTNEPGVLARVSGILAGRGFNIDSLVVCKTEQARKQLEDLVPVYAVLDYTYTKSIERELLLIKVWTVPKDGFRLNDSISPLMATSLQRQTISELARLFNAKVSDISLDCMVLELCAKPERIDSFIKLLNPYGIIELTRSGLMAMPRDPVDGFYSDFDEGEALDLAIVENVDDSQMPPG